MKKLLESRKSRGLASLELLALISVMALWCGCRQELVSASPEEKRTAPRTEPIRGTAKQPQPKLPTTKLYIGTKEITAELATTKQQIQTGMMWRTNMAEMEGMLFVFPRPTGVAFYMRNTLVPLTCAYIDPEGVILELHDMKPLDETPIPSQSDRVQYVLEMKQGWFKRHDVKPGMQIGTAHGPLRETFFRR